MYYDDIMAMCEESTFSCEIRVGVPKYRKSGPEKLSCGVERCHVYRLRTGKLQHVCQDHHSQGSADVSNVGTRKCASRQLVLHAAIRPYKDNAGNITVVLFCLCDILESLRHPL